MTVKRRILKVISLLLVIFMLLPMIVACNDDGEEDSKRQGSEENKQSETSGGNKETDGDEGNEPGGNPEGTGNEPGENNPPVLTAEELFRAFKAAGLDATKAKVKAKFEGSTGVSYLSGEKSYANFGYDLDPESIAGYGIDASAIVKNILIGAILGAKAGEEAYASVDELEKILIDALGGAFGEAAEGFGGTENYITYLSAFTSLYEALGLDPADENVTAEVDAVRTLAKAAAFGKADMNGIISAFGVLGNIEGNEDLLTFAKSYKEAEKSFSLNYLEKDNYNTRVVIPALFAALENFIDLSGEEARLAREILTYPGGSGETFDFEGMAKDILLAAFIANISVEIVDSVPPYSEGGEYYSLYEKDGKYYYCDKYEGISEFDPELVPYLVIDEYSGGYYIYDSFVKYFDYISDDLEEVKEIIGPYEIDLYELKYCTLYPYPAEEKQAKEAEVGDILIETVCEALYNGKADFAYLIDCAAKVSTALGADEGETKLISDIAYVLVAAVEAENETDPIAALADIFEDEGNTETVDGLIFEGYSGFIVNFLRVLDEYGNPFDEGKPYVVAEFVSKLGCLLTALDGEVGDIVLGGALINAALALYDYDKEAVVTVDDVLYEVIKQVFGDDAREEYGSVRNYITMKVLALVVPEIADTVAENLIKTETVKVVPKIMDYIVPLPETHPTFTDQYGSAIKAALHTYSVTGDCAVYTGGLIKDNSAWYSEIYPNAKSVDLYTSSGYISGYLKTCSLYDADGKEVFADDIISIGNDYEYFYYEERNVSYYLLSNGSVIGVPEKVIYVFIDDEGGETEKVLTAEKAFPGVLLDNGYLDSFIDYDGEPTELDLPEGYTCKPTYYSEGMPGYNTCNYFVSEDGGIYYTGIGGIANYASIGVSFDVFDEEGEHCYEMNYYGYVKVFDYCLEDGSPVDPASFDMYYNYDKGNGVKVCAGGAVVEIPSYFLYDDEHEDEKEAFAAELTECLLSLADMYFSGGDKENAVQYISEIITMFDTEGAFSENLAAFKKNVTENAPAQYEDLWKDVIIPSFAAAFPEFFGENTTASAGEFTFKDAIEAALVNFAGIAPGTAGALTAILDPEATAESFENALYAALSLVKYGDDDLTGLMAIYDFFKDFDPAETVSPETVTRILAAIDESFEGEMKKLFDKEETHSFGEALGRAIVKIIAVLARAAHVGGDFIVMDDSAFIEKYDIPDRLGNSLLYLYASTAYGERYEILEDMFGEALALVLFDDDEFAGWASSEFGKEFAPDAVKAGDLLGEIISAIFYGEETDIAAKLAEFVSIVDPDRSEIYDLCKAGDESYVALLSVYFVEAFAYLVPEETGVTETLLLAIADFGNIADYKEDLLGYAEYYGNTYVGMIYKVLAACGYIVAHETGDVDAAELLSFIPVPEGIVVDYDVLLDSLRNSTDPDDIFSIDLSSELTPNAENGELTSVTLTLKAVLGAEIVSFVDADAEMTLSVTVEF